MQLLVSHPASEQTQEPCYMESVLRVVYSSLEAHRESKQENEEYGCAQVIQESEVDVTNVVRSVPCEKE